MDLIASIISIKTPNFEAMQKFFEDLEFDVRDSSDDQLCPLFGTRGVSLRLADVVLNLEEDTSMTANASFNITLFGYPLAKLMRLQERVGGDREESLFWGAYYTFTTPDGGKVVIGTE
jgi:hypothetical protein